MKVDNYRQEHIEIFSEIRVLTKYLNSIEDNLVEIEDCFKTISSKLKRHIAKEDKILYPAILNSNDEELQTAAKKCQQEMGNISDLWIAFVATWGDPEEIVKNKSHFIIDFKRMVLALGKRVLLEENELYPKIENHFKITGT